MTRDKFNLMSGGRQAAIYTEKNCGSWLPEDTKALWHGRRDSCDLWPPAILLSSMFIFPLID